MIMVDSENSSKEYVKFAGVIAGILAVAVLLYCLQGPVGIESFLRWFMGVFFVVFASFKFAGYRMFAMMFAGYDVVAKRVKAYAYAYPFIELGLGIMYLGNVTPNYRDIATLSIMSVGTIGVMQEIKKRSGIHCACLGNLIKLPLSTVSLVEDLGMGLMALFMLLIR